MHSYADMFIRMHTPTHVLMHAFPILKCVFDIQGPTKEHTDIHTNTRTQ